MTPPWPIVVAPHLTPMTSRCPLLVTGILGALLSTPLAQADLISGLWNSGVDTSGNPQSVGAPEVHYQTLLPIGANPDYLTRVVNLPGSYVRNPADAAWIGPTLSANEGALVNDPVGAYAYGLRFSLAGLDADSATLSGRWASDNNSSIWLNGLDTGLRVGFEDFGHLTDFSLYDGMIGANGQVIDFQPLLNLLEFRVVNGAGSGNPSALLVSGLTGQAAPATLPDRPEVPDGDYTLLLLGGGFAGLISFARAVKARR